MKRLADREEERAALAFARIERLQSAIETVIHGKSEAVRLVIVALIAGGHILIEDVPGVGKTTLAQALARSLDLTFQRIQFTSDLLPSDLIGLSVYNERTGEFEFKAGPIFANVILADEINRTTPKTQSALLEAMAEGHVTVEGETYPLPQPFVVIATQNPIEHHGTYPLPESQLDRFMLRVRIGYPEAQAERRILHERAKRDPLDELRPVMNGEEVWELRRIATQVRVDDALIDYLLRIVDATRRSEMLDLGVSPRGTLALFRAAQALALTENRAYCVPDDIKRLVMPVFAHRLVVNSRFSSSLRRSEEAEAVLREIIKTIAVPV
ncbi:AAA family ATPase [Pyrinomonas methylaliphatogenes]|jgi:MoxR-like ATPase|uniref:MoxR-like ATPase n=1 Tax=Pyrinomonas methylaliphatogenes TaxID=454194 RepID=A0A0B6WVC8_9BACT|nr:AAA family ATPase [Pyrinomonas methylaliphatogenes]MBX5477988.1 AAA family ATPase [Pyrinomonas methylaliphatogenes]CDM65046.1 MoxR-like ATPase [Pyrinomonas methylaliphatogenes]